MSLRVLILVEGQTEERFVKDVLSPAFSDREIYFFPRILATKRLKDGNTFKGGVTNYAKFRKDALALFQSVKDGLATTMLDYYQLPDDFPGMDSRMKERSAVQRVIHVEQAMANDFGSPKNFIPYLMCHEFEALLFASTAELPTALSQPQKQQQVAAIRAKFSNPEDINDHPTTAPSKRILELFPDYNKVLHGSIVTKRIGLDCLRKECPHFNEWLTRIENYSTE